MLLQDREQGIALAEAMFPELRDMQPEASNQGEQSETFVYADRVVQIPRNSAVFSAMAEEVRVLNEMAKAVPHASVFLRIPEVLYFDGENPILVLSSVPGAPVKSFALASNAEMGKEFGERLGYFLAEMHKHWEMSKTSSPLEKNLLENIARQSEKILSSTDDETIRERILHVLRYIDSFDDIDDTWTTIHGDVSISNSLYCEQEGFGLVDFTSVRSFYGHMDFARIYQKFPRNVYEAAVESYERQTGRQYNEELVKTASDFRSVVTAPLGKVAFRFTGMQASLG